MNHACAQRAKFANADLEGADLSEGSLEGATFSDANFNHTRLVNAFVSGADFRTELEKTGPNIRISPERYWGPTESQMDQARWDAAHPPRFSKAMKKASLTNVSGSPWPP